MATMNAALTRKIVAFNGEEICDINWAELCKGAIGEGDDGAKPNEMETFAALCVVPVDDYDMTGSLAPMLQRQMSFNYDLLAATVQTEITNGKGAWLFAGYADNILAAPNAPLKGTSLYKSLKKSLQALSAIACRIPAFNAGQFHARRRVGSCRRAALRDASKRLSRWNAPSPARAVLFDSR